MDIFSSIKLIIGKIIGTTSQPIDYIDVENVEEAINTDQKFANIKDFIFERDDNECKKCFLTKNLVVHQIQASKTIYSESLVTLCYWCHLEAHGEKLFDSRKIGLWDKIPSSAILSSYKQTRVDDYTYDFNEERRKKTWTIDFNNPGEADGEWAEIRENVFTRDGYRCVKCGFSKNLTVDHITPRHSGGTDELSNLRTLCVVCHEKVHNRKIFGEDEVFTNHPKTYHQSTKVQTINSVINSKSSILINYTDEKGNKTQREIEPLRLFEEHGILYVRAQCHLRNAERTFRISRITI